MKTDPERFNKAISMFPKAADVLMRLDMAKVPYAVGGSVALYVQGNTRLPHDVDIMFLDKAHDAANKVFGLTSEVIKRSNVSMHKSSPVNDGSVDFLSHYTVIADGIAHHHPPSQRLPVEFRGRQVNLIPAEKIVAIKLIGRREHHKDLYDVMELLRHSDFSKPIFWEMVDLLNARKVVTKLLASLEIAL